jgi:polyhydroxybutyrate depolymerase
MQSDSGLDDIADVANLLVVYPEGVERSWNAGGAQPGYAAANDLDEAAFVGQMLSDLGTVASIDPKRIYAVGMSQGGTLAYRLACEMSDIFAAIAPVAAFKPRLPPCRPQQAVSVIHVHGLADEIVPYSGGGPYGLPPVEPGIKFWVDFAGCFGSAVVERLSNGVTHTAYASCEAGTAVELYTIESGHHVWPQEDLFPATEILWEFFAAHPKP